MNSSLLATDLKNSVQWSDTCLLTDVAKASYLRKKMLDLSKAVSSTFKKKVVLRLWKLSITFQIQFK